MIQIIQKIGALKRRIQLPFIIRKKKKLIQFSSEEISSFHDLYKGGRCFIVGNGPSLTTNDLEKLKKEITFSSNRVFNILDKTSWRPTFYCVQDYKLICKSIEEIRRVNVNKKIVAMVANNGWQYPAIHGADYINLHLEEFYPNFPKFSENILEGIYEGYTVTYACIQLAVYMGFKEIYLIGVDHHYSSEMKADGSIILHEGVKDHFDESDKTDNYPQLDKSTLAYFAARKYADEHNIIIYNATRGGSLEVFERVNFDDLFDK